MELQGTSIIGRARGEKRGETLQGLNPATGERLTPMYYSASMEEMNRAAELAQAAFSTYSRSSGSEKGKFLRLLASKLEAAGSVLTDRVVLETGLARARVESETARTCGQLRMFAEMVEEGSWVDARIDRANPSRQPVPKPDVRSMMRPLGPVAVFCASNFPLAFSVAGGDTASALAAGNPVIVNAHYAHPGTAEIVGTALQEAVRESHLPEGVFSLLYGAGYGVGQALVSHPLVKAVGFTGSRQGGLALMKIAEARREPIPVFAEMSSVNPVFILPRAMMRRSAEIQAGLYAAVTLGAGQFCTNPGLVVVEANAESKRFTEEFARIMLGSSPFTLLTPGIRDAYLRLVQERGIRPGVKLSRHITDPLDVTRVSAATLETDAATLLSSPDLSEEIFGPSTLIVRYAHQGELLAIARGLEGHLTATIHATEEDLTEYRDLVEILETKVGRLLVNGFPTGVEVCHAMVHGGPFPATSDGRSTSVGTRAAFRFTRLLSYQNVPDPLLPDELKDPNPLRIMRMVDGKRTTDPIKTPP
jgi:NADP-dependent aldehyde dehydrogenase